MPSTTNSICLADGNIIINCDKCATESLRVSGPADSPVRKCNTCPHNTMCVRVGWGVAVGSAALKTRKKTQDKSSLRKRETIHWYNCKNEISWLGKQLSMRVEKRSSMIIARNPEGRQIPVCSWKKVLKRIRLRLDSITDSMDMSLSKLQKMVKGRETWRAAVHGVAKSRTRLSQWTTGYGKEKEA